VQRAGRNGWKHDLATRFTTNAPSSLRARDHFRGTVMAQRAGIAVDVVG
jgi:hypothetical protein